jgi:large subunit ribosomal protein L17
MRHQKAGKKLNRTGSHRNAMFRNMVTSLFTHNRIRTTHTKAKELMRWADQMITLAKRGDLHARRQALAVMRDKSVVHRLFEEAQSRFGDRAGGYTRAVRIGRRPGDAAPVSLVEFVAAEDKQKRKKKKPKAPKKKEVATAKKEVPIAAKEKTTETQTTEEKTEQPAKEMEKQSLSEPEGEQAPEEVSPGAQDEEPAKTKEDKAEA